MSSLTAYETLAAYLNELGDEFMAISIALGWATPLLQAVKIEFRPSPRTRKRISVFLIAVLSCLAAGQADATRPNSLQLAPCGEWTITDFMTAIVADFSQSRTGKEFLAALDADPQAPSRTETDSARILQSIQDRYPNCCSIRPRKIDDPLIAIIERIVWPDEKTVQISANKRDGQKNYIWSFIAIYDFDRCGVIRDRYLDFQRP